MKKRIENGFWFIVENGPAVFTILFSIYVIAIAQTKPLPTDILLQWVLAILGLLATSELVERLRKIRHIEEIGVETLAAIKSKFGERQSADYFFLKRLPQLNSYFEKAMDIRLSGVALQRTIREHGHILAQRLREGANLKIIIVNPEGIAAQRFPTFAPENVKANILLTLQSIQWLSIQPGKKGKIELRYIDEYPHYNVISIDDNKDYGVMFIEFYAQRWVSVGRPRMELTVKRDPEWFSYFKEQFDLLWNDCQEVDIESEAAKLNKK